MKRLICLLLPLLFLCLPVKAMAQEQAAEIYTVEDLLAVADDPTGSYVLMADLDLAGIDWPCPDFSGSFDGNGHAIINLTLNKPGASAAKAYDGNRKEYEVRCVGLFGVMRNAQVKNLRLINVRSLVQTDEPCFVGAMAGVMEHSTITGCTILGNLELRAHDRIFGLGGAVGYGCGEVSDCTLDVTLICTDTDAATKDEQFLGGVYSTGFVDVIDCKIRIDGYVSEHGYAHNGGIVGMYMQYPWGKEETGRIQDNRVDGKITFFEDNDSRRAYCDAFVGESLVYYKFYKGKNISDFKRDERREYDRELRPDMCRQPNYSESITPPQCGDFGYTTYTCGECGYSYTDHYILPQHNMTEWIVKEAATEEREGLREATCSGCGLVQREAIPKLEPTPVQTQPDLTVPDPQGTQTEQGQPQNEQGQENAGSDAAWLLWVAGGLVVAAGAVLVLDKCSRRKK